MLEAIFWGIVQGLTEFLPISSSGHLVLVPALLGTEGPDLATTAVLHVGTLAAVVAYYRSDLVKLVRFRTNPEARTIWKLLIIGSIPAGVAGLALQGLVEDVQESTIAVAILMLVTGVVLYVSGAFRGGTRTMGEGGVTDALVVGVAQLTAVFPGISRSGMTITAGQIRGLSGVEAARFAFLLGIPVIAAAGLLQGLELQEQGGLTGEVWLGVAVAGVVGYASIALLLRIIQRFGLRPFAWYCFAFGTLSLIVL